MNRQRLTEHTDSRGAQPARHLLDKQKFTVRRSKLSLSDLLDAGLPQPTRVQNHATTFPCCSAVPFATTADGLPRQEYVPGGVSGLSARRRE